MKEIFKEIIVEEWNEVLAQLIPRDLIVESLPGKATVLTGIRRSGKSTYLRSFIRSKQQPYFYINFSDERLSLVQLQDLGLCLEAFYELKPDCERSKIYIGLDEIQIIPGWELFVDRLLRNKLYEIYITGSSARLLSKEIGTQMRGRSIQYEVFPYSFLEYIYPLQNPKRRLTVTEKGKFTNLVSQYLNEGGFPETRGISKTLQIKVLQEYYSTIIYKDIVERHNPRNPHAVSICLKVLMNQVASLYSETKIFNKCKSMGLKISKSDVGEYISWFQDCYLLNSVPIFTENINRQMTNPKKIYCIDNGFTLSNQSGVSLNSGHLLENLVFNILRRKSDKIFYYKNRSEVDFVYIHQKQKPILIQVAENLHSPETKEREISALLEAMSQLKLKTAWIITMDERGEVTIQGKKIFIIPLLDLLLFPEKMILAP